MVEALIAFRLVCQKKRGGRGKEFSPFGVAKVIRGLEGGSPIEISKRFAVEQALALIFRNKQKLWVTRVFLLGAVCKKGKEKPEGVNLGFEYLTMEASFFTVGEQLIPSVLQQAHLLRGKNSCQEDQAPNKRERFGPGLRNPCSGSNQGERALVCDPVPSQTR